MLRTRFSWRRLGRLSRAGLGVAGGMLTYPAAWIPAPRHRDKLAAAVADLLVIGFYGATPRSPSARLLAHQVRMGLVGGVFFVAQNIGTRADTMALLRLFQAGGARPLLAIDHEGGIVQRLTEEHGFTRLPCARDVATALTPAEARTLYARAGRELTAFGFNVNFGPVVDFDDPANGAIGAFGRAYGCDPERIAAYAGAFLDGFAASGVICAVKHFPGHGRSVGDSHDGPADVSATWEESELEPFARLIAARPVPMVMGGHLRMEALAPQGGTTSLSAAVMTGLLRGRLGYDGVTMTDDLDMDALRRQMPRREAVIQALRAGNDLLMIKNLFGYDPLLPWHVASWVRTAVARGELSAELVFEAAKRVRSLRRKFGLPARTVAV